MHVPIEPVDPEPRWDLVAQLRAQIAQGDYVTPEKLVEVADRLLEVLRAAGGGTAQ